MEVFGSQNCMIIHADIIHALGTVDDNSVDLMFADPPYNIGKNFNGHKDKWTHDEAYLEWCYTWLDLCCRKLNNTGSFYVMTSTQFMPYFDIYLRNKLEILSRIIWSYDSSGVQAKNYFGSMYEPVLFCVKDKNNYTFNSKEILIEAKTGAKRKLIDYRKNPPQVYNSQKVPGNVWEFPLHQNEVWKIPRVRYRMNEYENHPTQKPIALLERIIKASSTKNDLVLDPFSGTFTTGYVAKNLNRRFIGVELQEEYIKIGLRRLEIADEYKGKILYKEPRSFETAKYQQTESLSLFKEKNGNYLHGKHQSNSKKAL